MATQRGNTAHFPSRHSAFTKQTKNFARGYSKCLHKGSVTITYWNDNNAVCFVDNDIDSSRETWETTGCRNRHGEETGVHIPRVAAHYRSVYGWVDRCNQQLAYYNAEFRSVRKQNRVLDSLLEMYVLVNGHTVWANSNLRSKKYESSDFRFEIIRIWYAKFKVFNARQEVLHYPLRQPRTRRKVTTVILSPRKGKQTSNVSVFQKVAGIKKEPLTQVSLTFT